MFDWIKNLNKEYPQFWKNYVSTFETKPFSANRYIVLSNETTGLNATTDTIMALSVVAINDNFVEVKSSLEIKFEQSENDYNNIECFLKNIKNGIFIGHRVDFDIEILNNKLSQMGLGKLKNQALDIEIMYRKLKDFGDEKKISINEMNDFFYINSISRQSVSDDALEIAVLFLKLKGRLGI